MSWPDRLVRITLSIPVTLVSTMIPRWSGLRISELPVVVEESARLF